MLLLWYSQECQFWDCYVLTFNVGQLQPKYVWGKSWQKEYISVLSGYLVVDVSGVQYAPKILYPLPDDRIYGQEAV